MFIDEPEMQLDQINAYINLPEADLVGLMADTAQQPFQLPQFSSSDVPPAGLDTGQAQACLELSRNLS